MTNREKCFNKHAEKNFTDFFLILVSKSVLPDAQDLTSERRETLFCLEVLLKKELPYELCLWKNFVRENNFLLYFSFSLLRK